MTTFFTIMLMMFFTYLGAVSLADSKTTETALWGIAVAILWAALII